MDTLSLDELLSYKTSIENIISYYNALLYDINEKIKITNDTLLFNNLNNVYGNDITKISKTKLSIILSNNKFKHYYNHLFQKSEDVYGIGLKILFNDNQQYPIFNIKIKSEIDINKFKNIFNCLIKNFDPYSLSYIESIYVLNNIDKRFINAKGLIFDISQKKKENEGINKLYWIDNKFYIYNNFYAFNQKQFESTDIEKTFNFIKEHLFY